MKKSKTAEVRFNTVKRLIQAGMTGKEISEMLDVSQAYVSRVKTAETFEKYAEAAKQRNAAYLQKQQVPLVSDEVAPAVVVHGSDFGDEKDAKSIETVITMLKRIEGRLDQFEDTYSWVAKNAVIDTKRRRWL